MTSMYFTSYTIFRNKNRFFKLTVEVFRVMKIASASLGFTDSSFWAHQTLTISKAACMHTITNNECAFPDHEKRDVIGIALHKKALGIDSIYHQLQCSAAAFHYRTIKKQHVFYYIQTLFANPQHSYWHSYLFTFRYTKPFGMTSVFVSFRPADGLKQQLTRNTVCFSPSDNLFTYVPLIWC